MKVEKPDPSSELIDHIHLRTANFDLSCPFYIAIFDAMGRGSALHKGRDWLEIGAFYLEQAEPTLRPSSIHLCFRARSRDEVEAFHREGLKAGGRDNGLPGLRDYHPGYYAAFLLDPDGNNIEAKFDERTDQDDL
ncbi:VOC family protein [Paracoccus caeni]|uniref:VOC family protein n=1 Tax=Paracoccus caeni TaxID=657651 RepID=A0A934SC78_9RHOB|nr:VOC family protein [Paracoccus caeni]MBK4215048.1 VOC family protein [Paracoccus caeni]